jgi:hypothetical protein
VVVVEDRWFSSEANFGKNQNLGWSIMVLRELWEFIEKELFPKESRPDLFNQYQSVHENLDLSDAASVRRRNLRNYFDSFSEKPPVLLVGEAAGPWGCRFSGVAFTGEKQLCENSVPFPGERSSRNNPEYPIRRSQPFISTSAKIFWDVLKPHHPKFFVWDCVPFHPHVEGALLSIRTPRKDEIKEFSEFLDKIIEVIKPAKILAIGRPAQNALSKDSIYVRHPANGGGKKFREGMERFFSSFSTNMADKPSLPFARSYWVQSDKILAGCYAGSADYEEAAKKLSGLLDCGIRHIINLMEEEEKD